jgi:GNAT superfamily N-acetyltransferase
MIGLRVEAVESIPDGLRRAYLASLAEPQELYVEQLVAVGQAYILASGPQVRGYAIVAERTMVEFHVDDTGLEILPALFALAIAKSRATRALCKTFDTRMVTSAASIPAMTRTAGFLFRELRNRSFVADPQFRPRLGTAADVDSVWSIHDGFFEDRDEVERYTADDRLFLYETPAGELVGCGILTRVIADHDAVDVGMVVAEPHRRRGLGAYIAAHLKHCCLENAGFVTAHSLIEFTY